MAGQLSALPTFSPDGEWWWSGTDWKPAISPDRRFRFDGENRAMGEWVEGTLANMNSRTTRTAMITVGVIALILGGVWIGQGMNLIPGSFMTGSLMWLSIGFIVAIIGIILILLGLRRPGPGRTTR